MKLEKQRLSRMKTIISLMKQEKYNNQEELMTAILKVLCSKGEGAKHQFRNSFSFTDFSDDKMILKSLGLSRTLHGKVVNKEDYEDIHGNGTDIYDTLEA